MKQVPLLFLNVIIIATCGLIYELLAATVSSYVLGDSVTQFSLVIGIYLSAMGVGSWLSGFLDNNLAKRFVEIELAVAVLGGFSAPLLFLTFASVSYFNLILYGTVFVIGVLVGLEIPLLMRILKDELDFKKLVARVLALDYVGALVASLLFPIFLAPSRCLLSARPPALPSNLIGARQERVLRVRLDRLPRGAATNGVHLDSLDNRLL